MKYKVTLNNRVYEVEVEEGQAMLVDEYALAAPAAPAAAAAPAARLQQGSGTDRRRPLQIHIHHTVKLQLEAGTLREMALEGEQDLPPDRLETLRAHLHVVDAHRLAVRLLQEGADPVGRCGRK